MGRFLALLLLLFPCVARAQDRGGHVNVTFSLAAFVSPIGFGGTATLALPLEPLLKVVPAPARALPPPEASEVVEAAWRAAGLGGHDGDLAGMAARARWSALLPETRLRVLRQITESSRGVAAEDLPTSYTDGNSLWLEARLAWQLDKLVFASEETAIERLRMERQQERGRVAAKVVSELGKLLRAELDLAQATAGAGDHTDALVRAFEARLALDALTNRWFSQTHPRKE